jgi:hypothetical protein
MNLGRNRLLLSFPHSPERTNPEPSESERERNRGHQTPGANLSRMKFRVLAEESKYAKSRHRQKYSSHDFEPQLVRHAGKRPQRRRNGPLGGADGAIAPGLLACNSRHHAELLPGRNFAHALDFSSLRRYNDPTAVRGEPFLGLRHLRNEGETWIRN